MTEINPLKRNVSADEEIRQLDSRRSNFLQQRKEKILELDVIDSDISFIEAQIANILINRRKADGTD